MSERIKEIREWTNLGLTALVVIAIPLGVLVMRDQRLQIEADADKKYVATEEFSKFETSTNNKLDKIADSVAGVKQDVAALQGRLAENNRKETRP